VDVDEDRPAGGGDPLGNQLGHGAGVGVEVLVDQLPGEPVGTRAQRPALRGRGVDRTHADRAHLLPLVEEPLRIDNQPGQQVLEDPGSVPHPARSPDRDRPGVGVGHPVQLGGQLLIVEQKIPPNGVRNPPRSMRHVENHRGTSRPRNNAIRLHGD